MAQPKRYFEGHRSKQPAIPHVNKTFDERFMEVYDTLPPVELTPEQLAEIASQVDVSNKVDKVTGSSLLADTEAAKIHTSGSDNQDLSGLQPKETSKGLSTNDYTDAEETKLAGIESGANNYIHPTNHPPSIITQDASNRFTNDTEKSTWNGKTTLAEVKADSDISDSINKKHSQNTDTGTNSANFSINGANAIKEGDTRLTDARAPTAHNQDANTINSGTLDGDRLPIISTTKKGGVPATGTPSGKFLKDDNTWAAPTFAAHNLAGSEHNSDTLANLNTKISDADVVALAGQLGGTSASPDVRGIRESGGQLLTMGAVVDGQYLKRNGTTIDSGSPGGGSPAAWKGSIISCWKDGDPHWIIDSMLHNPIHATPTNISITVARCAFFKPDTNITVNKIRWFGVGATTGVYRVALYRLSDLVRLQILNDFNTGAQAWGNGAFVVSLTAGVIYFIAVAVDTVGTTAGVACHSGTTGRIGILPTAWPGGLQINAGTPKIDAMGFCQFAVTTGALPATAPTLALQGAWTGGMPAFFLDNNNA
jgi:hypothetical protein